MDLTGYIPKGKNAFASVLSDDFFTVVSNNGFTLNLLNPSGCTIWSKDIDFEITKKQIK